MGGGKEKWGKCWPGRAGKHFSICGSNFNSLTSFMYLFSSLKQHFLTEYCIGFQKIKILPFFLPVVTV